MAENETTKGRTLKKNKGKRREKEKKRKKRSKGKKKRVVLAYFLKIIFWCVRKETSEI